MVDTHSEVYFALIALLLHLHPDLELFVHVSPVTAMVVVIIVILIIITHAVLAATVCAVGHSVTLRAVVVSG